MNVTSKKSNVNGNLLDLLPSSSMHEIYERFQLYIQILDVNRNIYEKNLCNMTLTKKIETCEKHDVLVKENVKCDTLQNQFTYQFRVVTR